MSAILEKLVSENGLDAVVAALADLALANGNIASRQGDIEDAEAWYTAAQKLAE